MLQAVVAFAERDIRRAEMLTDLYELANEYCGRLPEMEERFNSLGSRYQSHRKVAEATVANWEWTALPRYELEPLFFEMGDARRGRVMRHQPEKVVGRHQYGFSSDELLMVERQFTELPNRCYEKFFTCRAGEVAQDLYSYDEEKSPINSTHMFSESDAYMCFQRWSTGGNAQIVFKLSEGRIIARLSIYRRFRKGDSNGGLHTVEYLADGSIRIWAMGSGVQRKLTYEGAMVGDPSIEAKIRRLRPSPAPQVQSPLRE